MNRLEFKTWRRARWLTQSQLAELLGVSVTSVWRWETGESEIQPYLHLALAQLDQLHTWSPDGVDALPQIGASTRPS
jgi:DNA-binding XRE family transcriptional regulator